MEVKCLGCYKQITEDRSCREIDFTNVTQQLLIGYVNMYEGFQTDIHKVGQFDQSFAVSTLFWEKLLCQEKTLLWYKNISLKNQSTTICTLLGGTNDNILLNIRGTRSFLLELYYLKNKSFPRFKCKT